MDLGFAGYIDKIEEYWGEGAGKVASVVISIGIVLTIALVALKVGTLIGGDTRIYGRWATTLVLAWVLTGIAVVLSTRYHERKCLEPARKQTEKAIAMTDKAQEATAALLEQAEAAMKERDAAFAARDGAERMAEKALEGTKRHMRSAKALMKLAERKVDLELARQRGEREPTSEEVLLDLPPGTAIPCIGSVAFGPLPDEDLQALRRHVGLEIPARRWNWKAPEPLH